ncbi:MAG: hypothetical protein J6X31_08735 [Bacteroidales bacterium]|nr:hypothetical protein [Bacteroidales bacterium]
MKSSKKTKKFADVTIPHSKVLWLGIILCIAFITLFLWLLFGSRRSSDLSDMNLGSIVAIYGFFLSGVAWFSYLGYSCIAQYNDYFRFTEEGIQYVVHPTSWIWGKHIYGNYRWEEIEGWYIGGRENVRNSGNYLFIKLYAEDKPFYLNIDSIHRADKNLNRYFTKFIIGKWDCSLPDMLRKKDTIFDIINVVFGFVSLFLMLFCFKLYDKTFIVSWFWIPVIAGSMLAIVPLSRFSQFRKASSNPTFFYVVFAFNLGLTLCYGILKVNYVFADWESEPTVRTCEFIGVSARHSKSDRKKNIGYSLRINTGKEIKSIDVSTPNQGQTNKTIDFYVYKGALGLDVME